MHGINVHVINMLISCGWKRKRKREIFFMIFSTFSKNFQIQTKISRRRDIGDIGLWISNVH